MMMINNNDDNDDEDDNDRVKVQIPNPATSKKLGEYLMVTYRL